MGMIKKFDTRWLENGRTLQYVLVCSDGGDKRVKKSKKRRKIKRPTISGVVNLNGIFFFFVEISCFLLAVIVLRHSRRIVGPASPFTARPYLRYLRPHRVHAKRPSVENKIKKKRREKETTDFLWEFFAFFFSFFPVPTLCSVDC